MSDVDATVAERGERYDHPRRNFMRIALLWNAYIEGKYGTDVALDDEDVGCMMILLKIAREAYMHTDDNTLDIAGYAKTLEMLHRPE